MKKVSKLIILILFVTVIVGCEQNNHSKMIVTTSFPSYDLVRAITKNSDIEVKMLLHPGSEIHDYEPTPQDIINIKDSLMFVYIGGESEDIWVEPLINNIELSNNKIMKLMNYVSLIKEDEEEMDEHIWTSPKNMMILLEEVKNKIIDLDIDNKSIYEENANNYLKELDIIDKEITEIINNSKRKTLVFGDRFPLIYFVDNYKLNYYAAFNGCSDANEISARTLSFLIDKVKKEKIPVVFHIELSNQNICNTISNETGAKVLEFHTAHNISEEDFNNDVTYVDLYKRNIEVLKEALG